MKFIIDQEIINKFSGLTIGMIICKNVDNVGEEKGIQKEIQEQEDRIRKEYNSETLSQIPKIDTWRKAYASFGAKPKENKSSVENLHKLILQGTNLKHINKLVDIYNLISLKHMLPIGGEDIDKIKGDVLLTFAKENEPPVLLLGDKEPRPPHIGEVIYKDDISAICRRWNWRESDRTKFTVKTKNCFLIIEGLPPVKKEEIEEATKELAESVRKYCGGTITYKILSKIERELILS